MPLPVVEVVMANVGAVKVAETEVAALMVMLQGFVEPVQAPVQPVNVLPGLAVAVRLINEPER